MSLRLRTACLQMLLSSFTHAAFGSMAVLEGLIQLHFPKTNLSHSRNIDMSTYKIDEASSFEPEAAVVAISNLSGGLALDFDGWKETQVEDEEVSEEEVREYSNGHTPNEKEDDGENAIGEDVGNYEEGATGRTESNAEFSHVDKRFRCEECGKRFKTRALLENHGNTHTGKKPFKCPHCDFSSAWKNSLHGHMRRFHPNEQLV